MPVEPSDVQDDAEWGGADVHPHPIRILNQDRRIERGSINAMIDTDTADTAALVILIGSLVGVVLAIRGAYVLMMRVAGMKAKA